ncbi:MULTISPECIES: NUDIX hydrolase [Gordonia]|uniref:Nudix hydrolase domain-containing protein n=2 Tax=Gordonia TaxID=2053 RepID=L7LNK5_9ACTN|nr:MULTISPECIES: NUDIX hydrolase [Gordonia]AUH67211.1 NUDIX domain-containing protein [Gordonia sp. YC-JH1]KJR09491.1 NUDIX hydrolase [Gordonia sihwensis]KXT58415.1 NUDIX hydrolase [Gordonia sp. QH-12]MBY4568916.1 NUDIX domain-containing protein [Gordonia sihwensis]WFN93137.1 NUDIX hydrolase [Gordonia sihwensis]
MRGDGDGWVFGADGARYWGRFGAAGLLLCAPADSGVVVLLQHRAVWSHQGGTWGLPGGARDSHESVEQAAVREAHEEAGIAESDVAVIESIVTHSAPEWSYTTVIAKADSPVATVGNGESAELRWVPAESVAELPLHPGLAKAWPGLLARLT